MLSLPTGAGKIAAFIAGEKSRGAKKCGAGPAPQLFLVEIFVASNATYIFCAVGRAIGFARISQFMQSKFNGSS
jgi:hypothetical protein